MGALSRHVVIPTIAALGLACFAPTACAQSSPASALDLPAPRIRTDNPILRTVMRDAMERSQTFQSLVRTIDTSDGIVYVQEGRCRYARVGCLVAVKQAGPNRILWVKVDTRNGDPISLAALIGHELQHVVEVLSSRAVTNNAALYLFYDRDGPWKPTFETEAAVQAGNRVSSELRRTGGPLSKP